MREKTVTHTLLRFFEMSLVGTPEESPEDFELH
jgi:hypothetical protein